MLYCKQTGGATGILRAPVCIERIMSLQLIVQGNYLFLLHMSIPPFQVNEIIEACLKPICVLSVYFTCSL